MDTDVLEEKIKVANNRIQKLEDKVDSLSDFKFTVNQLSDTVKDLKITVGTLTTAVNKLIKKGYLERRRIEEDRRVVLICTTKRGKLAYRLHEKFHNDMINETIKGLTDEQENILISALEGVNLFFKEKYEL